MQTPVAEEKSRLRALLRQLRDAEAPHDAASAAVSRRLLRLPELAGARAVLGYAAVAVEVSIDDALAGLAAQGATVCLPWVDGPHLHIASVTDLAGGLAPGWGGIREPVDRSLSVRAAQLDVVIAPGLGFDHGGHRLGHGGGHFDRLLGQLRRGVPVVGVALDAQVLDAIPVESHDRPVDVIVTPTRTLRPTAS